MLQIDGVARGQASRHHGRTVVEHFAGIDVRLERRSVYTEGGAGRSCARRRWRAHPGPRL
jgi:hypothetical protein